MPSKTLREIAAILPEDAKDYLKDVVRPSAERFWGGAGMENDHQCEATVYVRDTLRYSGRGKSGFEMHHTKRNCRRPARGTRFCWQHRWMAFEGVVP